MSNKKSSKSKTEKPPPIDKLLIPAVGVVVAFVAYYFMKGISAEVRIYFYFVFDECEPTNYNMKLTPKDTTNTNS
jgi:hypothetical protein